MSRLDSQFPPGAMSFSHVRGPAFRAEPNSQPAIWRPGGGATLPQSQSSSAYGYSSLLNSNSNPSHLGPSIPSSSSYGSALGGAKVYSRATTDLYSQNRSLNQQAPHVPAYSPNGFVGELSPGSSGPPPPPPPLTSTAYTRKKAESGETFQQSAYQSQPSAPCSQQQPIATSPQHSLANGIFPPPPPPSLPMGIAKTDPAALKANYNAERAAQENGMDPNDPNRSTIEYPEKESVAALRSRIISQMQGGKEPELPSATVPPAAPATKDWVSQIYSESNSTHANNPSPNQSSATPAHDAPIALPPPPAPVSMAPPHRTAAPSSPARLYPQQSTPDYRPPEPPATTPSAPFSRSAAEPPPILAPPPLSLLDHATKIDLNSHADNHFNYPSQHASGRSHNYVSMSERLEKSPVDPVKLSHKASEHRWPSEGWKSPVLASSTPVPPVPPSPYGSGLPSPPTPAESYSSFKHSLPNQVIPLAAGVTSALSGGRLDPIGRSGAESSTYSYSSSRIVKEQRQSNKSQSSANQPLSPTAPPPVIPPSPRVTTDDSFTSSITSPRQPVSTSSMTMRSGLDDASSSVAEAMSSLNQAVNNLAGIQLQQQKKTSGVVEAGYQHSPQRSHAPATAGYGKTSTFETSQSTRSVSSLGNYAGGGPTYARNATASRGPAQARIGQPQPQSPPTRQPTTMIGQTKTVDGDKVHTDTYFATPYREEVGRGRKAVKQADFRYEGFGPQDESGIPTGLREQVPVIGQHNWYRQMYKQLHHLDKREPILKYRMKDYWDQHYVNDPNRHREPNPYLASYKFDDVAADYMSEPEIEHRMTDNRLYHSTMPGRRKFERETNRSLRSKSAGRYEHPAGGMISPKTEVVKGTPAGDKPWHIQPRRIEDYVPGDSTLSHMEKHHQSGERRMDGKSGFYESRFLRNNDFGVEPTDRDPPIPISRNQAHELYKEIQAGRDVPYGGLRQPAPERRDISGNSSFDFEKDLTRDIDSYYHSIRRENMPPRDQRHGYLKVATAYQDECDDEDRPLSRSSVPDSSFDSGRVKPAPARKQTVSATKQAKALYDFSAQTLKELSLQKGNIVDIHDQLDSNWFEGECNGRKGIFPTTYVKIIDGSETTNDKESALRKKEIDSEEQTVEGEARAIFEFNPRHDKELPLHKSETIVLTRKIDDNWWEGRTAAGQRGIFPSNYVQVIREPIKYPKHFASKTETKSFKEESFVHPTPRSNASLVSKEKRTQPLAGPDYSTSSLYVNGVPYQSYQRGKSESRILAGQGLDSGEGGRARSQEASKVTKTLVSSSVQKKVDVRDHKLEDVDTYTAVYRYKPQHQDELEIEEGDIIMVVEKCDDGWYIGTSLRTGEFGTFPGNYVQLL